VVKNTLFNVPWDQFVEAFAKNQGIPNAEKLKAVQIDFQRKLPVETELTAEDLLTLDPSLLSSYPSIAHNKELAEQIVTNEFKRRENSFFFTRAKAVLGLSFTSDCYQHSTICILNFSDLTIKRRMGWSISGDLEKFVPFLDLFKRKRCSRRFSFLSKLF
jgi:hypothetical protein